MRISDWSSDVCSSDRDLGGAICRQLAADGLHVIVHANGNRARAEAVVEDIAVAGGSAEAVAFDVADGDATAAAIATLLEGGPVQVVVNNAGIHDDAPMAGMSAAQGKRVIDVFLHGFLHVTQPPVRKSVCEGKRASVRGDRGAPRHIKK